jgi:hypothetical protein
MLNVAMLSVIMLNVTMLSVVMLKVALPSVIILSVMVPLQVFQISMKNVVLLSGRLRTLSLVSHNPKNLANDKYPNLFDRTSVTKKKVFKILTRSAFSRCFLIFFSLSLKLHRNKLECLSMESTLLLV